ncbi:MAG: tRNA glutamyl-Q(34) synthetase GluQRS [Deltaproteobacteria bacterium]|nr:tRNA glutamyl-Q(34) synthetase GluQRS [Deltaproteobacteria bacterium]
MTSPVGRFAPSPTGRMHLGVARTSLAAWLDARARGGRILLRIEDIDTPRVVPGADRELQADLHWLGLDWDGDPTWQSQREEHYRAALAKLEGLGRVFSCTCSRKEIAASAPHEGEEGPRYPGTCRDHFQPRDGRTPAIRLRTEVGDVIRHVDRRYGEVVQAVHEVVGDFVLRRADGLWAYQLAVTVDDLLQGINSIVRGADLLSSTPRQLLLRRLLDPASPPLETLHVPLVLGPSGERLAKRDQAAAIAALRAAGVTAEEVVGRLAASLGLVPVGTRIRPAELVALWQVERVPLESGLVP